MLILHIVVALLGIVASTALYVRPLRNLYRATFYLLAGTLTTGTILVLTNPVHIMKTCLIGLLYTAFVAFSLYVANKQLSKESVRIK
jgi:Ca2+/Na+ antiporter